MSPLETALVILVSLWTLIFVVVAIAMVVFLFGLKKALDKINYILSQGEEMAHGLGAMSKTAGGGLAGFLLKAAGHQIKKAVIKKSSRPR